MHILLIFLIMILVSENAFAYVDPGTGGLLYQLVILFLGVVAGYFAIVKGYIRKILNLILKKDESRN